MKKVIVTGATGFIGKFLVRELVEKNIEVIAIVRPNSKNIEVLDKLPIRIMECNSMDYGKLDEYILDRDIDTVFHTAWQGVADSDTQSTEIQLQNIKATVDLIDVINKMKIRTFVGCGSIHEVESIAEMEKNQVISNPKFVYKAAKLSAHWMGKAKAGAYGIRFFYPLIINAYGAEEVSNRLVNTIIREIINGETVELSEGKQLYDFVYVTDIAKALCAIADKGIDGKNYTIGSGKVKQLKEYLIELETVVKTISRNDTSKLEFGKIKSNVISLPEAAFDSAELQKDTGYRPEISFAEGIKRTTHWLMGKKIEE